MTNPQRKVGRLTENFLPCKLGDISNVPSRSLVCPAAHILIYRVSPAIGRLRGLCSGHTISYQDRHALHGSIGTPERYIHVKAIKSPFPDNLNLGQLRFKTCSHEWLKVGQPNSAHCALLFL